MLVENDFVRTHKERVKYARGMDRFSDVSVFDRNALVKFLLLEDLYGLYKVRLSKLCNGQATPDCKLQNTYAEIIYYLNSAMEVAHSFISAGDYKCVRSNIKERALMAASKTEKRLSDFYKLVYDMFKKFCSAVVKLSKGAAATEMTDFLCQISDELPIAVQTIIAEAKSNNQTRKTD